MDKSEIKRLISNARIDNAIKLMLAAEVEGIELQSGLWYSLKREERSGTISRDNANMTHNRIVKSLLSLLDDAPQSAFSNIETETPKTPTMDIFTPQFVQENKIRLRAIKSLFKTETATQLVKDAKDILKEIKTETRTAAMGKTDEDTPLKRREIEASWADVSQKLNLYNVREKAVSLIQERIDHCDDEDNVTQEDLDYMTNLASIGGFSGPDVRLANTETALMGLLAYSTQI